MKINTFTFGGSIDKNKLIDPSYQVEGNKKLGERGIRLTRNKRRITTLIIGYSATQKGTHGKVLFPVIY